MKHVLVLALLSTLSFAISAKEVYNIARTYTIYPSTIVAMAKVESSLGKQILGDNGKSLGILQVQVSTLKFLATKDRKLAWVLNYKEKILETMLLTNEPFNIYVGSSYLNYLVERYGYRHGVMRYNGGHTNWTYYNKVKKAMK